MNSLVIHKVKTVTGRETDVFVEDGIIARVEKNIRQKAKKTIDGRGLAILPGFYNLHTHAATTLLRGYAEDMTLKAWLEEKMWPAESQFTATDIYWGTKLAIAEMIKSGTVFFNNMYWHQEAEMEAAKEMGIGALIGLTLLDSHPLGSRTAVIDRWRVLKEKQNDDVRLAIAPHAIYTVSEENLRWAVDFARREGLWLHLHLSETQEEVSDCLKKHRCRPVEYLDKLGVLGRRTVLAHAIWLNEKEIGILARRKCHLVHNPVSNMKLTSGIIKLDKIKKAGAKFCLGSDGASSNNNLDLVEEMKFAAVLHKLASGQEIKAKDIYRAATKQGARAAGLRAGTIKEGQRADFILIDTQRLDFLPGFDLLNDLVYSASSECVVATVCAGRVLMEERKIKGEKQLIREIAKRYGGQVAD